MLRALNLAILSALKKKSKDDPKQKRLFAGTVSDKIVYVAQWRRCT
jgi:hypothetical protein